MRKTIVFVLAGIMGITMTLVTPNGAFAHFNGLPHNHRGGGGVAAAGAALGFLGGVAVGAAIAGANRRHCHRGYCHRHNYVRGHYHQRSRPVRRRVRRGGSAHENWCYSRYRSYRAYDNTYQPYRGGRRRCISPYY
ncbi:MAG: BA14K family protein [Pseudomonadota bacterium]